MLFTAGQELLFRDNTQPNQLTVLENEQSSSLCCVLINNEYLCYVGAEELFKKISDIEISTLKPIQVQRCT